MDPILYFVQWVHVVAAIVWVGGSISTNFAVVPLLSGLPPEQARVVGPRLVRAYERLVIPAALVAGVSGLLRGTVFGPVRSLEVALGTAYGLTFLASVVVMVIVLATGATVAAPAIRTFVAGQGEPEGLPRFRRAVRIELSGLLLLVSLMILMRFGL